MYESLNARMFEGLNITYLHVTILMNIDTLDTFCDSKIRSHYTSSVYTNI